MQGRHDPPTEEGLRKRAISALLAAQIQLCIGQIGMHAQPIGPLTHLHTDPPLFWEIDAFYFDDMEPATAVAAVRACQPNPRHTLLTFTNEPDNLAAAYTEFGYQNGGSMPLMRKVLTAGEEWQTAFIVERVTDQEALDRLNSDGLRMPSDHLHVSQLRYYFVEAEGLPICWGRAFYAPENVIYISAVGTRPAYRRSGLATALMATIHAEAAALGQTESILCASEMAYALYAKLGYQPITTLLELVPNELRAQDSSDI